MRLRLEGPQVPGGVRDDRDGELLVDLPHQGVKVALPGLPLPAGKVVDVLAA
jgi:hypothetical protein